MIRNRKTSLFRNQSPATKNQMANTLGTFATLILLFTVFVALKNKNRFADELENKVSEQQKLKTSQEVLEGALATLKELPIERENIDSQTVAKNEEKEKIKQEIDSLKESVESTKDKIASLNEESGNSKDNAPDAGAVRKFANVAKKLTAEIAELNESIESKGAKLTVLTQQITNTEAKASDAKQELDIINSGQSLPSLKTSIRNIYPNWGFVTLNAGNDAGIVYGSSLEVVRNGDVIAKLLVTSVENRSASASIVPESLGNNIVLQSGDYVVPAKTTQNVASN